MKVIPDLRNITVNGIPLKVIVDDQIKEEIRSSHDLEVKSMGYVKILHIPTKRIGNTSGSRSGRGRIIYSRAVGGAL